MFCKINCIFHMYLLWYFLKLVNETLYKKRKKKKEKAPVLFYCIFPIFAFKIVLLSQY